MFGETFPGRGPWNFIVNVTRDFSFVAGSDQELFLRCCVNARGFFSGLEKYVARD